MPCIDDSAEVLLNPSPDRSVVRHQPDVIPWRMERNREPNCGEGFFGRLGQRKRVEATSIGDRINLLSTPADRPGLENNILAELRLL